ncbi:hypothetical protein OE810_11045 [Rhodobacteraceae bacterium XHP0102]|nr:hypothetical protein [Rhodobacteraceae bacterium XHP0102]
MLRTAIFAAMILGLAGCSTRLNPFNWFGNDRQEQRIEVVQVEEFVDPRPLITDVISLEADQVEGGAIIRAMGRADRQGYWEAELVEISNEDGLMLFEFRVVPPRDATAEGAPRTREVLVGTFRSANELRGVTRISVQGANNRRTVSR